MTNNSKTYVCEMCFREFPENLMKKNQGGEITNQCITCYNILGKGAGYSASISDEKAEKWFEGATERENKLKEEGRI